MNTEYLERVEMFAIKCHADNNLLYDGKPYSFHLEMVVAKVKKYLHLLPKKDHDTVIAAAWCHDIIEDAGWSYNDIKKVAGEAVAEIVFMISDHGRNRKERADSVLPFLYKNNLATYVKIADRLANTEYGKSIGSGMYKKYVEEYIPFKAELQVNKDFDQMWKDLDELNEHTPTFNKFEPDNLIQLEDLIVMDGPILTYHRNPKTDEGYISYYYGPLNHSWYFYGEDDIDCYLFTKVSDENILKYLDKEISLYDLIKTNNIMYHVTSNGDFYLDADVMLTSDVEDHYLPDKDVYYNKDVNPEFVKLLLNKDVKNQEQLPN